MGAKQTREVERVALALKAARVDKMPTEIIETFISMEIVRACQAGGDINVITYLLEIDRYDGFKLRRMFELGFCPLHVACQFGQLEKLKYLVKLGFPRHMHIDQPCTVKKMDAVITFFNDLDKRSRPSSSALPHPPDPNAAAGAVAPPPSVIPLAAVPTQPLPLGKEETYTGPVPLQPLAAPTTMLSLAAMFNHLETVEYLLSLGANFRCRTDGLTALDWTCLTGASFSFRILYQYEQLNFQSYNGSTSLPPVGTPVPPNAGFAAAPPASTSVTPTATAPAGKTPPSIPPRPGAKPTDTSSSTSSASAVTSQGSLRSVLTAPGPPNAPPIKPEGLPLQQSRLHLTAHGTSQGHVDIISVLLSHESILSSDTFGRTALHFASATGYMPIVDQLIQAAQTKKNIAQKTYTGSSSGSAGGNTNILSRLVNARTVNGHSPLVFAIVHNNVEVVELLLSVGADPLALDTMRPPLHWACYMGNLSIVRTLLPFYMTCMQTRLLESQKQQKKQEKKFKQKAHKKKHSPFAQPEDDGEDEEHDDDDDDDDVSTEESESESSDNESGKSDTSNENEEEVEDDDDDDDDDSSDKKKKKKLKNKKQLNPSLKSSVILHPFLWTDKANMNCLHLAACCCPVCHSESVDVVTEVLEILAASPPVLPKLAANAVSPSMAATLSSTSQKSKKDKEKLKQALRDKIKLVAHSPARTPLGKSLMSKDRYDRTPLRLACTYVPKTGTALPRTSYNVAVNDAAAAALARDLVAPADGPPNGSSNNSNGNGNGFYPNSKSLEKDDEKKPLLDESAIDVKIRKSAEQRALEVLYDMPLTVCHHSQTNTKVAEILIRYIRTYMGNSDVAAAIIADSNKAAISSITQHMLLQQQQSGSASGSSNGNGIVNPALSPTSSASSLSGTTSTLSVPDGATVAAPNEELLKLLFNSGLSVINKGATKKITTTGEKGGKDGKKKVKGKRHDE